jgi:hypothetical protein
MTESVSPEYFTGDFSLLLQAENVRAMTDHNQKMRQVHRKRTLLQPGAAWLQSLERA